MRNYSFLLNNLVPKDFRMATRNILLDVKVFDPLERKFADLV